MNIFKVLSNGDGSLNEPNVSAFLGYLLDPNADHGLNNLLLIKFLKNFVDSEFNINDYSYQFMYEQAFRKGKDKKDIVDIIIMCSYQEFGNKKESQLLHVLEQKNNKQRNKIIIIENKIKGDPTEGQLQNQYEKSIAEFEERESIKIKKEDILSLYVTPDSEKFKKEFEEFYKESEQGGHVIWNYGEGDSNEGNQSIKEMLIEIIEEDRKCMIDPINELTKHYIKSFIQFIDSGFKSEVQENVDKRNKLDSKDMHLVYSAVAEIDGEVTIIKYFKDKDNKKAIRLFNEMDNELNMRGKVKAYLRKVIEEYQLIINLKEKNGKDYKGTNTLGIEVITKLKDITL